MSGTEDSQSSKQTCPGCTSKECRECYIPPRELASIANAMATAIGNMNNFTLRFTQMEGVINAQSDAIMSLSSRLESIESIIRCYLL